MKRSFVKMQGLGNDFVVMDCRNEPLEQPGEAARFLCDRRFGVGADQLLLVESSPVAEARFRMAIFNADGSEVEMCGNGIRCFARYLHDHGLTQERRIPVHTDAGLIIPELLDDGLVRVDMGQPVLDAPGIPTLFFGRAVDTPFTVLDRTMNITCVSMGNPHCVIYVDDVDAFPVEKYGPALENDAVFPNRTNVEFVEVRDRENLKMRVWERGAGETMACGTGASAVLVASVMNRKSSRSARVHLKGGTLAIEWAHDNHVYMTGPAVEVFQGEIDAAGWAATPV